MRRLAGLVAAATTFAASVLLAVAAPAHADPISSCTTTTGTIVAVDFGHWGGPIVRGCGVHSATGYTLLHDAGFSTAGDQHDGPTFICRLGNAAFGGGSQYPTPAQDACALTPPASAYWSYWLAPAGQNYWTYSPLGVTGERPKPGEVELWRFGATNIGGTQGGPSVSPASLRAGNSPPSGGAPTSKAATSAPRHSAVAPGRVAATSHARRAGAPSSAARVGQSAASSATAAPSSSRAASSTRSSSAAAVTTVGSAVLAAGPAPGSAAGIVTAKPASASKKTSSGSAWPVVLALLIVAILGGGAGAAVRRRRLAANDGPDA